MSDETRIATSEEFAAEIWRVTEAEWEAKGALGMLRSAPDYMQEAAVRVPAMDLLAAAAVVAHKRGEEKISLGSIREAADRMVADLGAEGTPQDG